MARNGSGVYSLPAGSVIANGDTSNAADLNVPLADLEADMNTPRPVVAGGTGADNAADARTNLGAQAADADLTAIAGLSSNGIVTRTGSGTAAARTITEGAGITVTNGDGVSGNPTIAATIATGTAVTVSGTSVDFTSIPSWARRVTIMFSNVSTSGTSSVIVQIGDSGGVENTGYDDTVGLIASTSASTSTTTGSGFSVAVPGSGTDALSGSVTLSLVSGNVWVLAGVLRSSQTRIAYSAGGKTLSATLDRVRITTIGGSDTFDAGTLNVSWE